MRSPQFDAFTFVVLYILSAGSLWAGNLDKLKQEICAGRTSCAIAKVTPAGTSATGDSLSVAEVHLGLADKPKDGPEDGCRGDGDANDGGQEYWLEEGPAKPRLLLKLCNDGYGAAGVGEDRVDIGDNRFSHFQAGGSNDRWETTETIQLSPQRSESVESCSYVGTDPGMASVTRAVVDPMEVRSLAIGDPAKAGTGDEAACDDLRKIVDLPARPGLLAGWDVPLPSLWVPAGQPAVEFPAGTVLDGCAGRLAAGPESGNLVFGKPDPGRHAELRMLALGQQSLVIQIYDSRPDGSTAQSWVGADHLEIWTSTEPSDSYIPDPGKVAQLGVTFDGAAHAGVGKQSMPAVQHWSAKDEQGRPVTVLRLDWSDELTLAGGVVIAYSQGEGGKQSRIWATGPIRHNRPGYLPILFPIPVTCGAVEGRWEVTKNPGTLDEGGDQN
jgi:hypothetical protein